MWPRRFKRIGLLGVLIAFTWIGTAPVHGAPEPETLTNSLGMKFRLIPGGSYTVGPPGLSPLEALRQTGNPAAGREARVDPFFLGTHEVRVADYRAFCLASKHAEPRGEHYDLSKLRWADGHRPLDDAAPRHQARPITCVTFDDAIAFCRWLSETEGRRYRLATEVEWEYAARAGVDLPFHAASEFGLFINGHAQRPGPVRADPKEVLMDDIVQSEVPVNEQTRSALEGDNEAEFAPNQFGLFHMLGNVQEWVVMTQQPPEDDLPLAGWTDLPGVVNRMLRGGSWIHQPRDCTVYQAVYSCPPYSNTTIGFRVVLEVERSP